MTGLLMIACLAAGTIVGSYMTYQYWRPGIQLYRGVRTGEYNVILVNAENPRQFEAAMILSKGKIEMELAKEKEARKPHLEVVRDE